MTRNNGEEAFLISSGYLYKLNAHMLLIISLNAALCKSNNFVANGEVFVQNSYIDPLPTFYKYIL